MTPSFSIDNFPGAARTVPSVLLDLPRIDAGVCLTCCMHDHVLHQPAEPSRRVVLVVGLLSTHKVFVRAYAAMNPSVWLQAHADLLLDAGGIPSKLQTDSFEFAFEHAGAPMQARAEYEAFAERLGMTVQLHDADSTKANAILGELHRAFDAHLDKALDMRPRASMEELNESLQQLCAVFNAELSRKHARANALPLISIGSAFTQVALHLLVYPCSPLSTAGGSPASDVLGHRSPIPPLQGGSP